MGRHRGILRDRKSCRLAILASALREMIRVLAPGGWLLLSFHIGEDVVAG